jgi:uncharacterized membrane protein
MGWVYETSGLTISACHANAETYKVTDLGTLGGSFSAAININNIGQVVGASFLVGNSGVIHSTLWSESKLYDLNTLADQLASQMESTIQGQLLDIQPRLLNKDIARLIGITVMLQTWEL